MNIYSVFRTLDHFLLKIWSHLCIEHQCINSYMGSSGVGLHGCCHKALREEESRGPIRIHGSILHPLSKEINSFNKVVDPRSQRFKRRICCALPHLRHFFIKERQKHVLQLNTHDNCSFYSLLEISQTFFYYLNQSIKPLNFLISENIQGVGFIYFFNLQQLGHTSFNLFCHSFPDLVGRLAGLSSSCCGSWLHTQ